MIKLFLLLLINLTFTPNQDKNKKIILGAERLNLYKENISNKSLALLVNHSSLINNTHIVDTLSQYGYNIKKIFTPEHGLSGKIERGKSISDDTLLINNKKIPIISMYGKTRIPSHESLEGIDIVIFDIQDVGARFYTYISAMHNMMEVCASLNIDFIVLDRPNPNGSYIDGPVLEKEYKSYIGMHEIPIVHGCTVGELALMIKGEKWIKNSEKLNLKVIPILNWDHTMEYKLPVKPSPNLPNQQSILLYPSLCLFEQTVVSIGRGTNFPFQVIGHPKSDIKNFSFIPRSMEAESKPKFENIKAYGIDLRKYDVEKKLEIKFLLDFYNDLKSDNEDFFGKNFNLISGNNQFQNQIKSGLSEKEIRSSWKEGIEKYKLMRKAYLLYKDFE